MQPPFDLAACEQHRKGKPKSESDDPPIPHPAYDADACCEPGTGGAGQSVNSRSAFPVNNDSGAEKTDAGEDSLNNSAGRVESRSGVAGRIGRYHDHCRSKAHQPKGAQADRLAVQITVEAD